MNRQTIIRWWKAFRASMDKKHKISFSPKTMELFVGGMILTLSVSTYLYGMFLVLPDLLSGTHPKFLIFMRTLGTWLMIAVLSNMYLVRKRNSSIRNRMLAQPSSVPPISPTNQLNSEEEVKETTNPMEEQYSAKPFGNPKNWHICAACKVYVPPRSWHCDVCQTCILRRDHHCVFTGCCIGEENQSNFMGLVLYLAIGMTLSTIFSVVYHLYILEQNIWSFFYRSSPLYYVFYGFDVRYSLAALNMAGHAVAWVVFSYYVICSLKGQTTADAYKKIYWSASGCGRMSLGNLRDFLGPRPILRILWPFHSPLKVNYDVVQVGGITGDADRKDL